MLKPYSRGRDPVAVRAAFGACKRCGKVIGVVKSIRNNVQSQADAATLRRQCRTHPHSGPHMKAAEPARAVPYG
eukprot:1914238-Prymnesium_polylepis.1